MNNTVAASMGVFETLGQTIKMPVLPEDHNDLQVLAHEYALGCAEDELAVEFFGILQDAQDGEFRHVEVNMRGVGGNAMDILSAVKRGLKRGGLSHRGLQIFLWKAMRGNYEELLRTCATWVTIVDEPIHIKKTALDAFNGLL